MIGKCNYRHYMLKEIYEQPAVMGDTINTVIGPTDRLAHLPDLGIDLGSITRITIVACGTSYYSGLVAKYWLERYARIGVERRLSAPNVQSWLWSIAALAEIGRAHV